MFLAQSIMNKNTDVAHIQITSRILQQYNIETDSSKKPACSICTRGDAHVQCAFCEALTCPAHLLHYETANQVGYSQLHHMSLCVRHLGDLDKRLCILCNKSATGNALHGPVYSIIRSKPGWICSRCCLEDPSSQYPHPNCSLFALLRQKGLPVQYCNIEELSWQNVVLDENNGAGGYELTLGTIVKQFKRRKSEQPHKNLVVGLDVPEERWCIFTIASQH